MAGDPTDQGGVVVLEADTRELGQGKRTTAAQLEEIRRCKIKGSLVADRDSRGEDRGKGGEFCGDFRSMVWIEKKERWMPKIG
jgi:hypothetical protein